MDISHFQRLINYDKYLKKEKYVSSRLYSYYYPFPIRKATTTSPLLTEPPKRKRSPYLIGKFNTFPMSLSMRHPLFASVTPPWGNEQVTPPLPTSAVAFDVEICK
jgi:hypothetical protein